MHAVKFSNDLKSPPMLDLSAQFQQLKGYLMPAIESVMEKPPFINGSELASLFYYPLPLHKQEVFRIEQNLRICKNLSKHVLSLPIGSEMSKESINYITSTFK